MKVHDAKIVAAMKAHNIQNLLTFNAKDFKRYTFVKAVEPKNVWNFVGWRVNDLVKFMNFSESFVNKFFLISWIFSVSSLLKSNVFFKSFES